MMECPKCHSNIPDNATVCPKCRKVLALECPNCHALNDSATCHKCGFTILVKCSKCSKIVPYKNQICSKCRFPIKTSLAYQECESDDLASIIVKFGALRKIRQLLKSQELYTKFFIKLKNLLLGQLKGFDCKLIVYGDTFVINMNKELSFATSSNKATRLALKIVNAFVGLNSKIMSELNTPLNLTLTIIKKSAEELQTFTTYENDVKLLTVKKSELKYLKGFQIVLDQFVCDEINKEYKTDSLYTIEKGGKNISFYEIVLNSYILPPSAKENDQPINIPKQQDIKKSSAEPVEKDAYSFKVFDINAKCTFERTSATGLFEKLEAIDLEKQGKIIAIKSSNENSISAHKLANYYEKFDYKVLRVVCTEEMTFKPWGFLLDVFKEYFGLSVHNMFNTLADINQSSITTFKALFDLVFFRPVKALTPEDARFNYMESWNNFLSILKKTVIIVEGFENLDDTSLQTLELYFDKFRNVRPNFVFITPENLSAHAKLKGLLRTPLYTEFSLKKSTLDSCLETLKNDATDFIQSFYFEKLKDNLNGSLQYFENTLDYLKDSGVLIEFENKLIIKTKKSVVLPKDLKGLLKSRMKNLSRNMDVSLIFAYSSILGARLDIKTLEQLGIKDLQKNIETIVKSGLASYSNNVLYINNYSILKPIIEDSLKQEAEVFLAKTIIAQLGKGLDDSTMALVLGRMQAYKEEYLTLWKNSQFAMKTGDYDAYLKNCLGFLSLVEHISSNIEKDAIEENKKDVYNNILQCLYSYSPAKIYFIENMLLMDAINEDDDEKIVKLSNLMLQGALISSNYTDALGLLHNILTRMTEPTLIVDGAVNTKFLLLSLVNIEILYNIGDFRQCAEVATEILSVLSPDVLGKVKPASFSTNLFVSHVLETFRLAAFAKLHLMDEDLDKFLEGIKVALNTDLPEKDCVLAIRDFLSEKVYNTGIIENYTPFSKVIFLILQEFTALKDDYKRFAQNIYQAKLLAADIHQKEIELFCDLLIAYAYSKLNIKDKAELIYLDVLKTAEESAIFQIIAISKYLLAILKLNTAQIEESLLLINDTLAHIQRYDNQSKILYVLFEKLYIEIATQHEIASIDLESEAQKIAMYEESLKRILN